MSILWLFVVGMSGLAAGLYLGVLLTGHALATRAEECGLSEEFLAMVERLNRGL